VPYSYFEIACRCPLGKGFWPAFWLLPKRVGWPPEIDPLEASGVRRFSVHQGIVAPKHLKEYKQAHPPRWVDGVVDISKGFNVYAVEWTEKDIIFSVNGAETFRQPNVVNEPMYVLANLALGSHEPKWIPDPDASTPFPGRFEIDWIRVYRSTRS
jgi:beta-glucanase (GH16 family)